MQKQNKNLLGEMLAGKFTDVKTLSEKVDSQIEAGTIQVNKAPLMASPKACLNWGLTYKIYDCLYENQPLTPEEIASRIDYERQIYEKEVIVNHTLERMSEIGITKPLNHENLTSADIPIKEFSVSPILYQVKKWELTEYIKS